MGSNSSAKAGALPIAALAKNNSRRPGLEDPLTEVEGLDLVGILSSIDETAYVWHIRDGRLDWESNAAAVLGIGSASQIATTQQ